MKTKQFKLLALVHAVAAMCGNSLKAVVASLDEIPAEFHALYKKEADDKFVILPIEGLKPQVEFDRINEALRKERTDHSAAKTALAPFRGLDAATIHAQLDRVTELEQLAAGKVDDKQLEALAEARVRAKVAPLEREIGLLKTANGVLEKENTEFKGMEKTRKIQDHVRQAAVKVGIVPSALEDALMLGERMLELDEAGVVITRDAVGVTPGVSPEVWLQEVLTKRPHWVPPSEGGGARGVSGKGFAANPWSHEAWNMTEQMRIERADPKKAEDMARSAGTKIGGLKPPAKK